MRIMIEIVENYEKKKEFCESYFVKVALFVWLRQELARRKDILF